MTDRRRFTNIKVMRSALPSIVALLLLHIPALAEEAAPASEESAAPAAHATRTLLVEDMHCGGCAVSEAYEAKLMAEDEKPAPRAEPEALPLRVERNE